MAERITVFCDKTLGVIDPNVYGHFIEHIGSGIYDGVWVGEHSEIPNVEGIRSDVIDGFRELGASLIRWPGGCFADYQDWRDGIGSRDRRPCRFYECAPGQEEPNLFGTHEFMSLCELVGAQPNLCVNTGFLSALDARNWVEYCNHDGNTTFAAMRRANGKNSAWKVRYWDIGNESYSLHGARDYVDRYLRFRKYMRGVDPEIQCVASLIEPVVHPVPFASFSNWCQEAVMGIREHMELASIHLYFFSENHLGFDEGRYWSLMSQSGQKARIRVESLLGLIDSVVGDQRVKLAIDEWGVWYTCIDCDKYIFDQPCLHEDAVFAARFLHLLHEYPDRIGMACISESTNVIHSIICTDGIRSFRTPTFHVFEMFKKHQGAEALATIHTTPTRRIADKSLVLGTRGDMDIVTVCASSATRGREMLLTMSNADLHCSHSYELDVQGSDRFEVSRYRILSADPLASNTFTEPDRISPVPGKVDRVDGRIVLELPPCSVAALELKCCCAAPS